MNISLEVKSHLITSEGSSAFLLFVVNISVSYHFANQTLEMNGVCLL